MGGGRGRPGGWVLGRVLGGPIYVIYIDLCLIIKCFIIDIDVIEYFLCKLLSFVCVL